MSGKEPELVRSGGFQVDLQAALKKLSAFRDPRCGPAMFWARCAIASGAARLTFERRHRYLGVSFDGAPLSPELLGDPVGGLLGLEAQSPAARFFSQGFLHAWRQAKTRLSVASGEGKERRLLIAESLSEHRLNRASPQERGTTISLELSQDADWLYAHPRGGTISDWLWPPFPVEAAGLDDLHIERGRPEPGELELKDPGRVARLGPGSWRPDSPELLLSHYGVLVGELPLRDAPALRGCVDDDHVVLDAGYTRAVRNEASHELERRLLALAREVVSRNLAGVRERLTRLAASVEKGSIRRWVDAVERRAGDDDGPVAADLGAVLWLRGALEWALAAKDEKLSAKLRLIPLFLDSELKPFTAGRLAATKARPVEEPFAWQEKETLNVLCPTAQEREQLERIVRLLR